LQIKSIRVHFRFNLRENFVDTWWQINLGRDAAVAAPGSARTDEMFTSGGTRFLQNEMQAVFVFPLETTEVTVVELAGVSEDLWWGRL
jgi:hypothetical protein